MNVSTASYSRTRLFRSTRIKRAKFSIIVTIIFSFLYNIPHFFISSNTGKIVCNAYGKAIKNVYGQMYYWLSFTLNFALPFVLLLMMNTVIIHTLRKRSEKIKRRPGGQGQSEGESMKNTERQITVMLLLVTFGFLILSTPGYIMVFYTNYIDVRKSAHTFAGYYLFYNVGQKTFYSNYGINFFLYVISGRKFREDLIKLFSCQK